MKKISDSLSGISQKVVDIPTGQKVLILVLTILIIGGGYFYFSYRDKNTQIKSLERNIKQMESRLALLKKKSREAKILEADVKKVRKQLQQVSHFLPKEKEIPSLLDSISASGTDAMLDFLLFQPKSENPKDFYTEIPIKIEVRGTYHQVCIFLDKLSHMDRIVSARNLGMNTVGTEGENVILKSKFTAVTYRFIKRSAKSKKNKKRKK